MHPILLLTLLFDAFPVILYTFPRIDPSCRLHTFPCYSISHSELYFLRTETMPSHLCGTSTLPGIVYFMDKSKIIAIMLLFSHSVMSDSLQPHGLQHTRLPCPSLSLRVRPNSCPLNCWCHSTISSSAIPFSSCLQFFPASKSFPKSGLFGSGGQSVGTLASASVLLMNIQGWFPLDWFDLSAVQGTLKSLLQHQSLKASILWCSAFFMVQLSHPTWLLEKP